MARVFISYVHIQPDQALAQSSASELSGQHEVFIDTNLLPGQIWSDVIDRQLATADYFIVFLSAYSANSPMVEAELRRAFELNRGTRRPVIVPIRLDNCDLPYAIDAYTGRSQMIRWESATDSKRLHQVLLGVLDSLVTGDPVPKRIRMIQRVREDWIDGFLQKSFYAAARIELGLRSEPDAVRLGRDLLVQRPSEVPIVLPSGTRLLSVFDEHLGQLLILGEPGAGKTTLLLELTRDLLDRAERNAQHPIPVVFNLSSWAELRKPLELWMIDELRSRSDVPKNNALEWVRKEQILPLLDGLDEVSSTHRKLCIDAINQYRSEHGFVQLAICCRRKEYSELTVRLRIPAAVTVLPLSAELVQEYFEDSSPALAEIREELLMDTELSDFLRTPLAISVVALANRRLLLTSGGERGERSSSFSTEDGRTWLFRLYVEAMFDRRSKEVRYSPEQMQRWLVWLARALSRRNQTIFHLEDLRHHWVESVVFRFGILGLVVVLFSGISTIVGGPLLTVYFQFERIVSRDANGRLT